MCNIGTCEKILRKKKLYGQVQKQISERNVRKKSTNIIPVRYKYGYIWVMMLQWRRNKSYKNWISHFLCTKLNNLNGVAHKNNGNCNRLKWAWIYGLRDVRRTTRHTGWSKHSAAFKDCKFACITFGMAKLPILYWYIPVRTEKYEWLNILQRCMMTNRATISYDNCDLVLGKPKQQNTSAQLLLILSCEFEIRADCHNRIFIDTQLWIWTQKKGFQRKMTTSLKTTSTTTSGKKTTNSMAALNAKKQLKSGAVMMTTSKLKQQANLRRLP